VGIHYNPIHQLTCFKKKVEGDSSRLPVAELFGKSVISLPVHPFMTQAMIL
jgi:dTDP-4-amino-4,6-dideoxygalactose transaminase